MAARYVRIGQYPDYRDEIRGTLLEILASTANPGTYAAPEDVAGCTLEMGADGLWTGNLGTLTQAQADALVAAGVMRNVNVGVPGMIAGSLVHYGGQGVGWVLSVGLITSPGEALFPHDGNGSATFVSRSTRTIHTIRSNSAKYLIVCYSNTVNGFDQSLPGNERAHEIASTGSYIDYAGCVEFNLGSTAYGCQLTFNGTRTARVYPGGFVFSDPVEIPNAYTKGMRYWVHSDVTPKDSSTYVPVMYGTGENKFVSPALTTLARTGGGPYTSNGIGAVGPRSVLERCFGNIDGTLYIGDSITYGLSANWNTVSGENRWGGWAHRASDTLNDPAMVVAYPSGLTNTFLLPHTAQSTKTMLSAISFRRAIIALGTNTSDRTAADQMGENLKVATMLRELGIPKIGLCTIPPRTTSSDGFVTAENQTYYSGSYAPGGNVSQYNALVRSGVYSDFVVDIAATVSDAALKWRVDLGGAATTDGTHPNAIGAAAMARAVML